MYTITEEQSEQPSDTLKIKDIDAKSSEEEDQYSDNFEFESAENDSLMYSQTSLNTRVLTKDGNSTASTDKLEFPEADELQGTIKPNKNVLKNSLMDLQKLMDRKQRTKSEKLADQYKSIEANIQHVGHVQICETNRNIHLDMPIL